MTNTKLMIWLTLRAIVVVAISLFIAFNGQMWIQMAIGHPVSEMIYFIVVSIAIVVVVRLSTKRLLMLAEADHKQKSAKKALEFDQPALDRIRETGGEFRYPRSRSLILFGGSLVFVVGSMSSRDALWPAHAFMWACALGLVVIGVHELVYRVYVERETVRVKAFSEQQFRLADVAQVDVMTSRGDRTVNVRLSNGKLVRFSDPLQNLSVLLALFELHQRR